MGRQPLPIGAYGNIKTKPLRPGLWQAQARFRDADGETRQVKRTGRSRSAAENNLKEAFAARRHSAGAVLTGDSRLRDASHGWLEQRRAEVDGGDLTPGTLAVYEAAWRLYVEPALGELRLRELTVARCEAWKVALRKRKGPSATKSARTVLSGTLGYAARLGAIASNPCRDLSVIPGGQRKGPRALTREERAALLAALEANGKATRWDLPDLTRFMLATGVRVGEALAVSWDEIDLDAGTVDIQWRLVPVKGENIRRVSGAKSEAGERKLRLPRWCVDMLLRRRVDERSAYPVFPDSLGGWRYPNNMLKVLREARDDAGFGWVTSHVFRKTTLTVLDEAGLTPRAIADQAGHSDPSMTQRAYLGRKIASDAAADALEDLL